MRAAPRYLIPVMLAVAAFSCLLLPALRWGLLITLPLLGIAILDFFQDTHSLRRNYPLVSRIRWLFEDLRPFSHSYIVENDLEGRPFNRDERSLVYARAKGELDSHPMGTELDVYSDEYQWFGHSIVPNTKAPESWRLAIGGPDCKQPYSSALLNVSAMSFGALSANAIEALNKGAALGGFAHDTGEGGISRYHRAHGGDLIWEIGSGYFGCQDRNGHFDPARFADQAKNDQVKMVEVKLSQGAKPGHGGMLPGAKVTTEIAEARHVPIGQDCISPAAHATFSTPVGLLEWLAQLRELSGGKPVGFKLCVGQPHQVMAIGKAMLRTGIVPDFIVVDGAEGGTGAAPVELSDSVGMPLREGLLLMRNMLVGVGLKDRVKLGASGKIYSGAGMANAFAIGTDWCNAARAFMFSLGCIQAKRCHVGDCPTGIATQSAWRQKGLVVADKAERVARFQHETVKALHEIVVAMGKPDPWSIRPSELFQRPSTTEARPLDEISRFLAPGELVADPAGTPYARFWHQAQAESFLRAD